MHNDDERRQEFEAFYQSLTPVERRDRIFLFPLFQHRYNEIIQAHRVVQVPKYFWDKWVPQLGPVAATLYMKLRQYCYYNPETGERRDQCWPKQSTLAREIGVKDPKTLRKGLELLEQFGFIRREATLQRGQAGRIRRGTDMYFVSFEIPLTAEHAVDLLLEEVTEENRHGADHKGKKSLYGPEQPAVDNSDHKGRISLAYAREKIPSQRSTLKKNVINVNSKTSKSEAGQTSLMLHPQVQSLTGQQREQCERQAFEIGEQLKRMAGDRDEGDHQSAGFHKRVAFLMPERFIQEALMSTRDALDDQRSGRRTLHRGPAAYFAGVIRQIAEREGIDLGVVWSS